MRDLLNKRECNALKGVSILIIMWHNLVNMIENVVKVNEHSYYVKYAHDMLDSIIHPSHMTIIDIMSHWVLIGLLGITFVSGYGLVLKYEKTNKTNVPSFRFIASHYEKLIVLMAVGLVFYCIVRYVIFNQLPLNLKNIAAMLSLTANCWDLSTIKPMPFWYFGMIMQLYVIYCFFLYPFRHKGTIWHWAAPVTIMIIGLLPMIIFAGNNGILSFLRYNFPIGIVPFVIGVLAARYCNNFRNIKRWLAFIALILCVLFAAITELNVYTWLILGAPTYVFIAIFIVRSLPSILLNWAAKLGVLSSILYIIHPSIRLFFKNSIGDDPYLILLIYTLICIVIAIPTHWLLKRIPRLIKT